MWSRRSAIERCRSSVTAQLFFVHHLYNKILAVAEERHRSIADRRLHMLPNNNSLLIFQIHGEGHRSMNLNFDFF